MPDPFAAGIGSLMRRVSASALRKSFSEERPSVNSQIDDTQATQYDEESDESGGYLHVEGGTVNSAGTAMEAKAVRILTKKLDRQPTQQEVIKKVKVLIKKEAAAAAAAAAAQAERGDEDLDEDEATFGFGNADESD